MEKYDTLKSYDDNAVQYVEDTKNVDMSKVYHRFMILLPEKAHILDFGCGSGRDSKYFLEHGYTVTAIDGSIELCKLASNYIGQEVKHMTFDELDEESIYDGIWACASILHVERDELPDILRKMLKAIKDNGVIYTCFKKGDQQEIKDGKYYNYLTRELLEEMLIQVELNGTIVEYYETCSNVNRPSTTWGNYLIKKK